MGTNSSTFSKMIKAGRNTYFVDVKEAKNGNKYLAITESRFDGEKARKTSIRVFGEAIGEFGRTISEAVSVVSQS
jgi:hypothetical protein